MKKIISVSFLFFVLAGCNSTTNYQATKEKSDVGESNAQVTRVNSEVSKGGAICRQEKTIGSNVRRTVCRTKAQIEEEKKEAELAQRDMRRQVGGDINSSLKRGAGN